MAGVLPINTHRLPNEPLPKFFIPQYRTLPPLLVKFLQRLFVPFKDELMECSCIWELTHHLFGPEPLLSFLGSQIKPMAAPPIGLRLPNQACVYRISVDIAHHLGQIGILIHHNRLITPPEKRTVAVVNTVESLSVESIQMPHDAREISVWGTQTDVIVIPHQTVCKEFDSPTVMDFARGLKKGLVVLLVEKDLLPRASPVHDVIDSSRVLNTKRPGHDNDYHSRALTVNKRFDPFLNKRFDPFRSRWRGASLLSLERAFHLQKDASKHIRSLLFCDLTLPDQYFPWVRPGSPWRTSCPR